jgi:poly(A) polymerase
MNTDSDAKPIAALPVAKLRIIPREQHAVSRKNISSGALRVLYRLNEAGFVACLVGGAVRDLLLGGHPKDLDVATNATPEEVKRLFRNCRLIGRRFRLAHVVFGPEIIEVATFRGSADVGSGDRHVVDGRIVRDNVYGTIEEDALRRDFTVNALYYDISDFSVRDYVGGYEDVQRRELHLIGDPVSRYREDPVRMLRAVRLAAKLGFRIADDARAPFADLGELLLHAPPARLFDESLKLFFAGHGLKSFRALEESGLLADVFPLTARALAFRGGDTFRSVLENGLSGTDQRIAEGKPVTPAFLFATLLWGAVRAQVEREIARGGDAASAWLRVSHHIIDEQAKHVAIPRRFGAVMEEIWFLQPRFEQRSKKRVQRLLAHPRFRAAYDFLLLRAPESAHVAELGAWWTQVQELSGEQLAAHVHTVEAADPEPLPAADGEAETSLPPAKRARRRRPATPKQRCRRPRAHAGAAAAVDAAARRRNDSHRHGVRRHRQQSFRSGRAGSCRHRGARGHRADARGAHLAPVPLRAVGRRRPARVRQRRGVRRDAARCACADAGAARHRARVRTRARRRPALGSARDRPRPAAVRRRRDRRARPARATPAPARTRLRAAAACRRRAGPGGAGPRHDRRLDRQG